MKAMILTRRKKDHCFFKIKLERFSEFSQRFTRGRRSCCMDGKCSMKLSTSCHETSPMARKTRDFQIVHGKPANVVLKPSSSVKTSLPCLPFCYGYGKIYGINPSPFGSCFFGVFIPSYKNQTEVFEILSYTQNKGINTLRIPGTHHHTLCLFLSVGF